MHPPAPPGSEETSSESTANATPSQRLAQHDDSMPATRLEQTTQHSNKNLQTAPSGGEYRLVCLNLDLARQLDQCKIISRAEQQGGVTHASPGSPNRTKDDQIRHPLATRLRTALAATWEFVSIIQSYAGERKRKRGDASTSGNDIQPQSEPTPPQARPSIITFLNILSVYFQLMAVYDSLFCSLLTQLADEALDEFLGIDQLFGMIPPIQHSDMQVKILVHAILRQFELLEKILDLPTELCVTDKEAQYKGFKLLDAGCTKALLEAVGFNGGADCQGGLEVLSSLRESLENVQTTLDI